MRIVLDANVIIAAFGSLGTCRAILRLLLGRHPILYSNVLLDEVRKGLRVKAHVPESLIEDDIGEVQRHGEIHDPALVESNACRDPKDLHILGLAVAGRAEYIVTGDKDLLVLGSYRGIPIVAPAEFLKVLMTS